MADSKQITRQWQLLNFLKNHDGATAKELRDEFGVSLKTIRRDLDELRLLGFLADPEKEAHLRQRWFLKNDAVIPERGFTIDETAALFLGREFLAPLAGTMLWKAARDAFEKIEASLGELTIDYLQKFADVLYRTRFGQSDYSGFWEILDELMVASEDRKQAIILYQSLRATEPVEHEVHPYGIVVHKHALYLVAYSVDDEEIRHYKLNRISEVEISGLPFNKPKDFDLDAYFADALGVYLDGGPKRKAVVRFDRDAARYLMEHEWHPSQKLTPQNDGSILFEVELSSFVELKSFIQSFGRQALVLKPEDLRKEVQGECRDLLEQYEKSEADV